MLSVSLREISSVIVVRDPKSLGRRVDHFRCRVGYDNTRQSDRLLRNSRQKGQFSFNGSGAKGADMGNSPRTIPWDCGF